MTFQQILAAAKVANAPAHQVDYIEQLHDLDKDVWCKTSATKGTAVHFKTHLIRLKLERWLTAMEVGHKPDLFWEAVLNATEPLVSWTLKLPRK